MPSAGGHIPERGAAAAAQAASRRCWGRGRGRGTDVATATPAALQAQGLRSCGGSCRKGQEQGRPACPALSGGPRRLPGRLRSPPHPPKFEDLMAGTQLLWPALLLFAKNVLF